MYTKERVENIDLYRGIACLVVALFHAREICWIGLNSAWSKFGITFVPKVILGYITAPIVFGSIGVPIFFVISGYCIHRSHYLKLKENKDYSINIGNFLFRRFFRIYPVLIAALMFTFLFDKLSMGISPNFNKFGDLSFAAFLGNVFAVQGLLVKTYGSNIPLWSLSIEIQLYLFYLILFGLRKKIGIVNIAVFIVLINLLSGFYTNALFTSYLISWCAGAYIAEIESADVKKNKTILIIVSVIFFLIGGYITLINKQELTKVLVFVLWSISFSILFIFTVKIHISKNYFTSILEKIGTFSYSLYIIHLPVIIFLFLTLFKGNKSPYIFSTVLIFGLVILITYIFYLIIEKPTLFFLDKKKKSLKNNI